MKILLRPPFLAGAVLHLVFLFSRTQFLDLACTGRDCSGLVMADLPISMIYLAFPDNVLILTSLVLGSLLWGIWGLLLHQGLRFVFKE